MVAPIVQVSVRCRRFRLAETDASDYASAACYRLPEDVGVMPIVVAELELRDVERHIFLADLMECTDNAALNQRPKALDCLSVNCANNVFASSVVNRLVRVFLAQVLVADPLIGAEQADLVGYCLADEAFQGCGLDIFDDAGNNIAPALSGADHNSFAAASSSATAVTALVFVPIFREATDESFVNLDDADELLELLILQGCADTVAHVPSGFVRTEAHVAVDLAGTHFLFSGQHQVDDAEPLPQVNIRVLKNGASDVGKPIATRAAIGAFPFPFHGFERIDPRTAAARAIDAIGPAVGHKVGVARILSGEGRLPLGNGHLVDLAGLLSSGHDGAPHRQRPIWHP